MPYHSNINRGVGWHTKNRQKDKNKMPILWGFIGDKAYKVG